MSTRCAVIAIVVALALCGAYPALSADRSCWMDMPGKPTRPDVTCAALTERFLRSLEGASESQVVKAMGAPGERSADGHLYHYVSNYIGKRGHSGDVNITFENGRSVIVEAILDPENDEADPPQFLWNAKEGSCSDLPGSEHRCRD